MDILEQKKLRTRELWEAVTSLSTVQLLQLKKYSHFLAFSNPYGYSGEDLLSEAILATASDERRWNKERVDLSQHLFGCMRSITFNQKRKSRKGQEIPVHDYTDGQLLFNSIPSPAANPEETLTAILQLRRVRDILSGDEKALCVVDLLSHGYLGREIELRLNLSSREYAATVKRIRRRLESWGLGRRRRVVQRTAQAQIRISKEPHEQIRDHPNADRQ